MSSVPERPGMFHVEHLPIDVLVVGGGHAGIEAAAAAHRMGLRVRLVSMSRSNVGTLSCNPAVGGTAKGQVVKEIDALGGLMGEITDECSLQFKMLNKSKGAAVWSPRSQVSRSRYPLVAQRRLLELDPEMIVEANVQSVIVDDRSAKGVVLDNGREIRARAVILCAGTFLNAVMHTGMNAVAGGRYGERPASISTVPEGALHLVTARLKTGTPPRVSLKSLDLSGLEFQTGDEDAVPFSVRTRTPLRNSISCWLTKTSPVTHAALAEGFDRSPMFSGRIQGKGPRYCPSIEDKITRFAEKLEHHIFLEPEEEDGDLVYVNGFSTSLPADVQLSGMRTMAGMEHVEMIRPGYAVEYDYFPAYQLYPTLESRYIDNLYFAGQVNGTSGYEEAAAQGIVAGINAAAKLLGRPEFLLSRSDAYIGVLIDDLISKTQMDPYRLFTSSAEHRLLLRQDNADLRLSEKAFDYGLISSAEYDLLKAKKELIKRGLEWIETEKVIVSEGPLVRDSIKNRMRAREGTLEHFLFNAQVGGLRDALLSRPDILMLIDTEVAYEGYIKQHEKQIVRVRESDLKQIPNEFDFSKLTSLSAEASEALKIARPTTLGQASRLPGVTPADLSNLMMALSREGNVPRGTSEHSTKLLSHEPRSV